jgi:hypothetical protein
MADSNFRGPVNSMGALEVDAGTTASVTPLDGPSQSYQGYAMADPRAYPFAKDGTLPGRQAAFLGFASPYVVDAVPQATASNVIVAAQATSVIASGLLTIIAAPGTNPSTSAQFIAVGVPILPQGTGVVTTAPIALDFGFSIGTTTANSSSVTVVDNTKFTLGQWICIGNVGNASGTSSLLTQVQTLNTTTFTGMTVGPNLPQTALCAPIGQANLYGATLLPPATQFAAASAATYVSPNVQAGFARVHNPAEALARNVYIEVQALASAAATPFVFLVSGWDVWRMPMTEQISVTVSTTVPATTAAYGKKAFKYINSVNCTVLATSATVTVGIGDVFGFPLRADYFSQIAVTAGATTVASNVGFLAAVSTTGSPATNTTGDVRGTVQLSGAGGGTAITNAATTNGVLRLTIQQDPGVWNTINATPLNPVPMFGNTQSIT